jgi:hypothetical protein
MTEKKYISIRIVEGKPKKVIVDDNGKIINYKPNKDELEGNDIEPFHKLLKKQPKYTDDQLLDFPKQFFKKYGKIPISRDFNNNPNYPNISTFIRRFGSWNNTLIKAGLHVSYPFQNQTSEQLLGHIVRFFNTNGRIPELRDFNKNPDYPSFGTYIERFGSWNDALVLSGVGIRKKYTREELLKHIVRFYNEKGRIPQTRDFNKNPNYPSFNPYQREFGSWNDALRAAGFVPDYNMTEDELLKYIVGFYIDNHKTPLESDFDNNSKYPHSRTYIYRFGGWNNAIKAAGLQVNVYKKISQNDLLDHILQFYIENGRPPTTRDFIYSNHKYPSVGLYQKHFGSWENALKLVELDTESMIKKGIIATNNQKGRFAEILVRDHFKKNPVDLAANHSSPCDGICPNGKVYDVKSSALHSNYYQFGVRRHGKEVIDDKIEIYYLLGFNVDYSELMYAWRIYSIDITHRDSIYVGLNDSRAEFTVENMKEYDITENIREILA